MDPKIQPISSVEDDREWELTDEDLDRPGPAGRCSSLCSTSRPCTCARCHCR